MPGPSTNEALKEHLTMLKNSGIEKLSIPPAQGQRLRAVLSHGADAKPVTATIKNQVAQPPVSFSSMPKKSTVKDVVKEKEIDKNIESTEKPEKTSKIDIATIPAHPLPPGDKKSQWDWLRNYVLTNKEVLSHVRAGVQPVFGVGNINSPIFFCGEAPGAEEEEQGEPFVGRAGQLLTKIINAMGLQRSDVYIANILNWRPEKEDMSAGNRPPTIEEMSKCIPFLKAQVNIVKPQVIVALGATAVTGLLGHDPDRKMGDTRGQFHAFNGTPVMVTYHPSYLLRNNTNAAKRIVWEDLLQVMRRIGMPITPAQEKFFT